MHRVLMVDDIAAIRKLYRRQLLKHGEFDVLEAENGQQALDILDEENIDLVLTDWVMPVKDGLALLNEIKSDASKSHIPVIMVTSESKPQDLGRAAKAGVDGYLVKPFTSIMLRDKIKNVLEEIDDLNDPED